MGTLFKTSVFFTFLLVILLACERPADKFVGTWEYHSYNAKDSGLGAFADLIPENWKIEVDSWIENAKDLTNSTITFNADGTYEEHFRGAPDRITMIKGHYTVTPDLSKINLKTSQSEQVMEIESVTDTSFVYLKSFDEFKVPLTLEIVYKRVK
ncbi:MAG: lipocalin family protein [Brumimicrobium sp.]